MVSSFIVVVVVMIIICFLFGLSHELSIGGNDDDHHHDNNINLNLYNNVSYQCEGRMHIQQIILKLKQHPCPIIVKEEIDTHRKMKRQVVDAGTVNVHALQRTANDHRTLINYLINNSINATIMSDAIITHHSKTGPILSSWRDLNHLFITIFLLGFIIYLILSRTGCTPCHRCLNMLSGSLLPRLQEHEKQQQELVQQIQKQLQEQIQQQQQQFEKQQQELWKQLQQHQRSSRIQSQPPLPPPAVRNQIHYSTLPAMSTDAVRFNNGYMSDE
ncbi:unnamed protein product [Rotaria socialis]|uniref:Uncharacterized protein n=1 Tax=Rotaria socialis TaxID=392032 RepID=A0A818M8Q5_9BILA|nr:unnamed protein product [Rotaria socialis]CAF4821037.1 unnamed protein product [Rotaria socialis]